MDDSGNSNVIAFALWVIWMLFTIRVHIHDVEIGNEERGVGKSVSSHLNLTRCCQVDEQLDVHKVGIRSHPCRSLQKIPAN